MALMKNFYHFIKQIPIGTKVAFLLNFAIGFSTGAYVFNYNKNDQKTRVPASIKSEEKLIPVATREIGKQDVFNLFSTHANLAALHEVTLKPPTEVVVKKIMKKIGDRLKKGDIIVELDSELHSLKSELDKLDYDQKNLDYQLSLTLAKRKFISDRDFKQKQLEFRSNQIRRRMNDLESRKAIRAPIDGVLADLNLKEGDYVDSHSNFSIKIVDNSSYKLQLYLPQSVAGRLKAGMMVDLKRTNVLNKSEEIQSAQGLIIAVSPVVDPKTGSVYTEILASKPHPNWIAGMFVEVQITLDQSRDVIVVPNESIVFQDGKPHVFRIMASNEDPIEKVERIPVDLGITNGKVTEVREGIFEMDKVIVEGQGGLTNGSKVELLP